jgi:hypothetical protein
MKKKLMSWVLLGLLVPIPWFGVDFDPTINTHKEIQLAQIACCKCVSYLSNGTRFYHGVLPIPNCLSLGGHCEGEVPCFSQ